MRGNYIKREGDEWNEGKRRGGESCCDADREPMTSESDRCGARARRKRRINQPSYLPNLLPDARCLLLPLQGVVDFSRPMRESSAITRSADCQRRKGGARDGGGAPSLPHLRVALHRSL